ncbi:MAG: hypothetical protein WCD76_13355 [Pyrinomonadaceae bacterium]
MTTPNTFKQKNVFVAFSYFQQAAIGMALAAASLTRRLPLALDQKPLPTRRVTRDETRDCSGKYLTGRRLSSRLALWTIQLDATAQLAAWFLALALGDPAEPTGSGPYTHAINRLGSDQLPATSFIIGAEDSDEPAEMYRDMVLASLDIEATVRGKVTIRASFVGSADIETVEDFDAPVCAAVVPVYANDCLVSINSVNYTDNLRSFHYSYNNNPYSNDDPFPFDAVDLVRLERGIETSAFQFTLYGTKTHAVYVLAANENVEPVTLRLGSATEGTSIICPGAQLTLQDTPLGYAGEASRSVINIDATPFSVSGALPDHVVYVGALATELLTVPA